MKAQTNSGIERKIESSPRATAYGKNPRSHRRFASRRSWRIPLQVSELVASSPSGIARRHARSVPITEIWIVSTRAGPSTERKDRESSGGNIPRMNRPRLAKAAGSNRRRGSTLATRMERTRERRKKKTSRYGNADLLWKRPADPAVGEEFIESLGLDLLFRVTGLEGSQELLTHFFW